MPGLTPIVVFRADGSTAQGAGHVMRGLALAAALNEGGARCVFVLGDARGAGAIAATVTGRGHEVVLIPVTAWEDDATRTRAIATERGARLVITDICTTARRRDPTALVAYHGTLMTSSAPPFVVTFDDATGAAYASDVVVIPYFRAGPVPGESRPGQVRLAGAEYFVFRREFVDAAHTAASRTIAAQGRNVLVTIGGSDAYGVTVRVARAVATIEPGVVTARFVLGPGTAPAIVREVQAIVAGWPGDAEVLVEPPSLAALMLWADLAVTGEGLTKYETAVTATPSLMISQFDTDGVLVREFEQAGTTRHLGNAATLDETAIAKALLDVLGDAVARRTMAERGRALVDGRGVERILARLPKDVWTT